jgi:hypothetical protein
MQNRHDFYLLLIGTASDTSFINYHTADQKGSKTRLPQNTVPDLILLSVGSTYTRQSGSTLG